MALRTGWHHALALAALTAGLGGCAPQMMAPLASPRLPVSRPAATVAIASGSLTAAAPSAATPQLPDPSSYLAAAGSGAALSASGVGVGSPLEGLPTLWKLFPTGQGRMMYVWPVAISKTSSRILLETPGILKAEIRVEQGGMVTYRENALPPQRVTGVTATKVGSENRFAIRMESGQVYQATVLADGHTLRYQTYQLSVY